MTATEGKEGDSTAAAPAVPAAAAAASSAADGTSSSSSSSSSTNWLLVSSYATMILLWAISPFVLIPYAAHLLVLVAAILYAACHASLVLREEHPPEDGKNLGSSEHGSTSSSVVERETLRKEDAYQFPLVGSFSLFSLYLAFKFLDKDLVNMLIGCYLGCIGCLAICMTASPAVQKWILPSKQEYGWEYKWNHSLPEWLAGESPLDLSLQVTAADIFSFVISAVIVGLYYYQSKPWFLNNVLGICFCLQGIERFSLGTFKIGAILLIGLFFYDIFWVFGTEVMVTVAKNLDGPIKILLPRSLERDEETGRMKDLSLLGLGDIVIPGFFLALLIRFDAHCAKQPVHDVNMHAAFPKPYFHTALIAYTAGLGTTLAVMFFFNAAQPALLYLVPACLGSAFLTAIVRGELKELLDYSEEVEEEDEEDDDEKEKKKEEDSTTDEKDAKKESKTTTTTTTETPAKKDGQAKKDD